MVDMFIGEMRSRRQFFKTGRYNVATVVSMRFTDVETKWNSVT